MALESVSKMKDEILHAAESSPQARSVVIDLLEHIGVANLTGQVTISHPPILKGTYSDVYQGVFVGKLVCFLPLIINLLLRDNIGGH
jgi:hypothetical protein